MTKRQAKKEKIQDTSQRKGGSNNKNEPNKIEVVTILCNHLAY